MKKFLTTGLFAGLIFTAFSQNKALTDSEVRSFVQSSFKKQVGYQAAVKDYNAALSKNLVLWANPVWKNKPFSIPANMSEDGSKFYEDSVVATVHDVLLMGSYANVMGTAQYYIAGLVTTHRNFSCVITRENGTLKYIRFMGADHSEVAKNLLWPTVTQKSHEDAYFDMREEMMNLNNERALQMSDSLVQIPGTSVLAHLGQLQYYLMNNQTAKFNDCYNVALSKLEGASPAERHVILSYNTQDTEVTKYHLEQALLYAADDQFIRMILAYMEKDTKKAIAILLPAWDRFPENGGINNILAYKYMEDGQMAKAKQHFDIYMRVYPSTPNAYDSMGDYYMKAGDKAKAKEMYMKAYTLDNNWKASKARADKL